MGTHFILCKNVGRPRVAPPGWHREGALRVREGLAAEGVSLSQESPSLVCVGTTAASGRGDQNLDALPLRFEVSGTAQGKWTAPAEIHQQRPVASEGNDDRGEGVGSSWVCPVPSSREQHMEGG